MLNKWNHIATAKKQTKKNPQKTNFPCPHGAHPLGVRRGEQTSNKQHPQGVVFIPVSPTALSTAQFNFMSVQSAPLLHLTWDRFFFNGG